MRSRQAPRLHEATTPPIACSLSAAGRKERAGLVEQRASDALLARERDGDALVLRFRNVPEVEQRVRAWAALEAECRSFLTLTVDADSPAVVLRVAGTPEAQGIIDALLPEVQYGSVPRGLLAGRMAAADLPQIDIDEPVARHAKTTRIAPSGPRSR